MAQQFQQPQRKRREEDQPDIQESIHPSFYHPENDVSKGASSSISNIDDVLAENDAARESAKALDSDAIKSAEENASDGGSTSASEKSELDQLGKGYSEEKGRRGNKNSKNIMQRRPLLIGGGILGGGFIGLLLALFVSLPLKVQHMVNNIQGVFFSSAEQATEDMTETLFKHYLVKQVVPGMLKNNCTSTRVDKDCVAVSGADNIIGDLYNGWRDGKIEKRLADNGIEIRRVGKTYYIKTPSTTGDLGDTLGDFDSNNPDVFKNEAFKKLDGRADLRREIRTALKQDTKWDRVMYRFKVWNMLSRKYNLKPCVIACESRDRLNDYSDAVKKRIFSSLVLERVIEPMSEMKGLAMQCAIAGFSCAQENSANEKGEKLSDFETDLRTRLADYKGRYGQRGLDELDTEASKVREQGALKYLIAKLIGETATQAGAKAIPVIGWLDLAATIIGASEDIGPGITKLTYVMNSQTAVAVYGLYRTNADEIKTGKVTAAMVGSVATSLNATDGVERKDQGGVGMEGSPLYAPLMGTTTRTVAFNPWGEKAYAASKTYTCEDSDNKPPEGLVCPVERLDNVTALGTYANYISAYANSPAAVGGKIFTYVWEHSLGFAIDKLSEGVDKLLEPVIAVALALVPGSIEDKIKDIGTKVVNIAMSYVFKPTLTDSASGARMFNLAAAGGDEAGNSFAHYNLGGAELSDSEVFAIRQERENEKLDEFNNRSVFARMFSTDTSYSLVSKLALSMPGNGTSGFLQSVVGTISNPFSSATQAMASGPFSGTTSAATALTTDPFGITQYGYTKSDPVFSTDPEEYWKNNDCDNPDQIKNWGNKAVDNPKTEMPEHKPGDTNGCMLIKSAAGSSGAVYTDDVLDPEELGDPDPSTPPAGNGNLKVATYNMLAQDRASTHGYGGDERLQGMADLIDKEGFHIVAAQELLSGMQTKLMSYLPSNYKATENVGGDSDVVIYDSILFDQVDFGTYTVPKIGKTRQSVWVKLQSKQTNNYMYVFSMHNDLSDPGTTQGAQSALSTMQNLVGNSDTPVIIMGDMNSYYPPIDDGNETYKVFKDSGKLLFTTQQTSDRKHYDCDTIQSGDNGFYDGKQDCGRADGRHADQIWISNNSDITVSSWENIADDTTIKLSDHNPVTATLNIESILPSNTTAGFTVATYNILHAVSFPRNKCGSNESNEACRQRRSRQQARIIAGQAGNPALDIVGLQEVSQPQYADLKAELSNYDFAPKQVPDHQGVAITWNKEKFSYVSEGTIKTRNNVGALADTPWVKLETASGTPVYVLVTHSPNDHSIFDENGGPSAGPSLRAATANASLDWAKSKDDGKSLIFTMGDYNRDMNNRGNPSNGAYCIMTTGGTLKNTYDMVNKPQATGACPSKGEGHGIDHIYATPLDELKATAWVDLPEQDIYAQASDHTPVYATFSFNSGTSGSVPMSDDYATQCGNYPGVACDGQCVDFVKFRLKKHIDPNRFSSLGNGKDVAAGLGNAYGYTVNHIPAVNAVVSWPAGGVPGNHADDSAGHVAMVSAVNGDGSIVVEEYNYINKYKYGTRKISADIARLLTYAHTEVDFR